MPKDIVSKYIDIYGDQKKGKVFLPYEEKIASILHTQKWPIPEKIIIVTAITGAFFDRSENPHTPYTTDEIRQECEKAIENGACGVHVQVRNESTGQPCGDQELYRRVLAPLREKYGKRIVLDGCAQLGKDTYEMMAPVTDGFFETSPVNPTAVHVQGTILASTRQVIQAQTRIMQECGCKPQIAVHDTGHIENARRWIIEPGIYHPPYYWIIMPSIPGSLMMSNPLQMIEGVGLMLRLIFDIDKNSVIMIAAGGRASGYVVALALILGLHVRIGMEDTIFWYPHQDKLIEDHGKLTEWIVALSRLLGREPATAEEYRSIAGIPTK